MKNFAFILVFFLVFSSFCVKDEKVTDVAQILTNGAWIQVQSLSDDDGDGIFSDESLPCEKDNTWVFNTDHTMTINDIGVLCTPDLGSFAISGYWELNNNDQILAAVLSNGFTQVAFNITSISNYELILDIIPVNPTLAPTERYVLQR
jgi:hypothetical protein